MFFLRFPPFPSVSSPPPPTPHTHLPFSVSQCENPLVIPPPLAGSKICTHLQSVYKKEKETPLCLPTKPAGALVFRTPDPASVPEMDPAAPSVDAEETVLHEEDFLSASAGTSPSLHTAKETCSASDEGLRRISSFGTSLSDLDSVDDGQQPVWKVVLTGGPCGGKTTALSIIAHKLRLLGLQVFTVPENATLFSTAGAGFPLGSHKEHQLTWETSRMICQMQMEDSFENMARHTRRPTVILCDRGVVDAHAYLDDETWDNVLESMGWVETDLRDKRYDMVLHMVSTAVGAESCYENTAYRHETPQQAAELDAKIQKVWAGHRMRCEIDNSTGYDDKVSRVVAMLCSGIGISSTTNTPNSLTFELEASVESVLKENVPTGTRKVDTVLVFLNNSVESNYTFLRLRQQPNCLSFSQGTKTTHSYTERLIPQSEYVHSLAYINNAIKILHFTAFVWVDQDNATLCYEISSVDGRAWSIKVCAGELCHTTASTVPQVETTDTEPITLDCLPAWIQPFVVKDIPQPDVFKLVCALLSARTLACTHPAGNDAWSRRPCSPHCISDTTDICFFPG